MKRMIMLVTVLLLSAPLNVYADGPVHKLTRGIVNVVAAPVEIPKQARAYWIEGAQKTPHILVWIFSGTVWGVVQTVKRAGSGVWDIVSFPIDQPTEYQPLMLPEYPFQEWPRNPVSGR